MIYREDGWKAEVELLSTERDDKGVSMTFRIIQTLMLPRFINPEAIPKNGEVFTAWKSHNAGAYGWSVDDY